MAWGRSPLGRRSRSRRLDPRLGGRGRNSDGCALFRGAPEEVGAMTRQHEIPDSSAAHRPGLTAEQVWRELSRASFAVISYVTPGGEPRSSGVLCAAAQRRLFATVDAHSWKARAITDGSPVAVTIPLRRGG